MQSPIIHLNGSGKEDLLTQYRDAYAALNAAIGSLPKPNPRDYYPVEGAFEKACDEHMARLRKIDEVVQELATIYGTML